MKPVPPTLPVETTATERDGLFKSVRHVCKSVAATARLMVGFPDYEAYVRHRREKHPDEPVMTYEEFFRERQQSRYATAGGKISRCC